MENSENADNEAVNVERLAMCKFTDRELVLLMNATHERAMYLLDLSGRLGQKGYKVPGGRAPTKDDIDTVIKGHKEHLALVERLRGFRNT